MARIVLAHTGGFATTVAIPWLIEQHRADVVTVTLDLGQSAPLEDAHRRALSAGAVRAHVIDARADLADRFIVPALQAGVWQLHQDPFATALGHAALAKHLVEIARLEDATIVAHGAARAPDIGRIESLIHDLDGGLTVLAPAHSWSASPRAIHDFARAHDTAVPTDADNSRASNANLWARTTMCALDASDATGDPDDDAFLRTRPAEGALDVPASVEIEFERGVPVAVNGVRMAVVELIQSLETIGGAHRVGRIDTIAHGAGGPTRVLVEAPAAFALCTAHDELQRVVTARDLGHLMADVAGRYADLIDAGRWFSSTRAALDALVMHVQQHVTGTIRLTLFKGDCRVASRQLPHATTPAGPSRRKWLSPL